jgi:predicted nucleic acid-binding protein
MMENLSTLRLIDLDDEITHLGIELIPAYASKGLGGRDCVIIATMRLNGTSRILTHDDSFKNAEDLEVLDFIP